MGCEYIKHSQYHPRTGRVHVTCTKGADHYHLIKVPSHIQREQKERYVKAVFIKKDRTDELSIYGKAQAQRTTLRREII
jgi:hypothetical protein